MNTPTFPVKGYQPDHLASPLGTETLQEGRIAEVDRGTRNFILPLEKFIWEAENPLVVKTDTINAIIDQANNATDPVIQGQQIVDNLMASDARRMADAARAQGPTLSSVDSALQPIDPKALPLPPEFSAEYIREYPNAA